MANRRMERCSASLTREMQTQTTVRSHLTSSGWLSSERPQITSIVEDAGEGNSCTLPAGVQTGAASVENSSTVSPKVKTELPCDPEIPLLGTYPEGKKETNSKNCPAASFTVVKIWKKVSTDRWMKTWCTHTMEYCSVIKKSEILPFATAWMDLEGTMPSETSQTEEDKYCMISLTHGILQIKQTKKKETHG